MRFSLSGNRATAAGRLACRIVFLAVLWLSFASEGSAQTLRGVALVVGNGNYEHLAALPNPAADARAVEELFDRLGFDTTLVSDRDARRLSRDLERFLEDAEDADVAVVYYAGHGIEAGGENFLVPVDADLSALDAAGEKLVPISAFVRRLQTAVPLAIVLLDACRDNPFPPGSKVRLDAAAEPLPMGEGGLGETRGATGLAAPSAPRVENVGTVIAFAAEPGKVALDGAPGGNSPYAAAVLRHLDAMAGEEFGLVMRMVGEEVYLKTAGRQRPWVNESLRRQLFFGAASAPLAGEEGDILAERRQLLLTIAALPSAQRASAEAMARTGGVPMSIVYAMMQALDIDPGDDPEKVEDRLRAQIEQFAALQATRDGFESADPEILRLTALADSAEEEGALAAADELRERAKSRVAALRETREDQIETLRRRIVEDAGVFARSAETKKLLFRHAAAADDYAEAAGMVSRWDDALAASYRNREIAARLADAELRGTAASLELAETKAREALASTGGGTADAVRLRHALGQALMLRFERHAEPEALREALAVQREAAALADPLEPNERARLLIDAGRAAGQSGLAAGDMELLAEAERYFTQAAATAEAAALSALHIEARFRILQATYARWAAAPNAILLTRMGAEASYIVQLLEGGEPDAFSARYIARAIQMAFDMAQRINTPDAFATAMETTGIIPEIFDAGRFPLIVAEMEMMRGRIAFEQAERFGDFSTILQGIELQRGAVRVFADAGAHAQQQEAEWHLALTLAAIGTREPANGRLAEAIALMERLQADRKVQANPAQLRMVEFQLARLGGNLAHREGDEPRLRSAIQAMQAVQAAASAPVSRAQTAAELGRLHYRLATFTQAGGDYSTSVEWLETALALYDEWQSSTTNPAPYLELYAVYSDAAAALAFTTGGTGDVARAIAVNDRMLALFRDHDNRPGMIAAANLIGSLVAQDLQGRFDPERYAGARRHLDEAEALASAEPGQLAPLQRTGCLLELARGRHERTAEMAGDAISRCSVSLDTYETFGPEDMVPAARTSLEEAERLSVRAR